MLTIASKLLFTWCISDLPKLPTQTIAEKRDKAQSSIGSSSARPASSQPPTRGGSGPPAPAIGLVPSLQNYLRVAIVLCCVLYLIPLPLGISTTAYRIAAASGLCNYLLCLYAAHGAPQFNMEYVQRLLPDPTTMWAPCAFILALLCAHAVAPRH